MHFNVGRRWLGRRDVFRVSLSEFTDWRRRCQTVAVFYCWLLLKEPDLYWCIANSCCLLLPSIPFMYVRYINAIHAVQHLGNLCLHLLSHSWFFPNLHLIVIQSLNLWQSQLPVSCIKCPINSEVSTAFQFWVNLRYVRDRRRANDSSPQYKCTLAARRQTSNNARSLLGVLLYAKTAVSRCAMYVVWR